MFPGRSVFRSSADGLPPSPSTCMQASEKWARRTAVEPAVFLACPVLYPMVVLFEFYVSCCVRRGTFSLPFRRVPVLDFKGVKTSSPPSRNVERS